MVAGQSLILADEPTGALDSKSSKNLLEIMTRMNRDMNATILMVTHDLLGAADVADRIGFLRGGRLVEQVSAGTGVERFDVSALHRHYLNAEALR